MKRKTKQQLATILTLALTIGLCQTPDAVSAATIKLNKKKLSIVVGKTATLKLKGTKKRAKWTVKSGKKYIKLKAKKKASVKVYGVRKGTAKVQCKVGKKKLLCKVTVKAVKKVTVTEMPSKSGMPEATATPAISAMPVVTPTVVPTEEPSPEPTYPFEAYEWTAMQTPGPVADYDRLMVEVGVYRKYQQEALQWIYRDFMQFFGSGIVRGDIERISITDTNDVPSDVLGTIDVSEKQNGSVMAWYVDEDKDGKYEMTIGQDGGVVANENSSYLFSEIGEMNELSDGTDTVVLGLENLKTSHVTDMSYMFQKIGIHMHQLDLGNAFDVSKVEYMRGMFHCTGNPYLLKCYTTNENTYKWMVANADEIAWRSDDCHWLNGSENVAYIIYGAPNEETRPIHPPTDDCLMEEPVAVLTESGTVETYGAEEFIEEPVRMYFFGSDILREDIEFMTITDTTDVPDNAIGTIDVSEKQNGSVVAWYTDEDNDGDYEVTIGQEGGVILNKYASYLFYGIGRNAPTDHPEGELFAGFDKLYPNERAYYGVGMFACCGDTSGSFRKLDLGAFAYETFLFPLRDRMFWNCGNPEMTKYYMNSDFLYEVFSDEYDMFGGSDIMNIENMIAKY